MVAVFFECTGTGTDSNTGNCVLLAQQWIEYQPQTHFNLCRTSRERNPKSIAILLLPRCVLVTVNAVVTGRPALLLLMMLIFCPSSCCQDGMKGNGKEIHILNQSWN